MKTLITLSLVSAFSLFTLTGCGTTPSPETHGTSIEKRDLTQKQVHTLIKEAGEKKGWIITDFKRNELIAEKPNGENATAVTIKYSNTYFEIEPENSSLEDAISEALK